MRNEGNSRKLLFFSLLAALLVGLLYLKIIWVGAGEGSVIYSGLKYTYIKPNIALSNYFFHTLVSPHLRLCFTSNAY